MSFPTNPIDDDLYTNSKGMQYLYSSSENKWTLIGGFGITGVPGAQGVTGLQGTQGTTGIQGPIAGFTGAIEYSFDGSGSAITVGTKKDLYIPYDMTITGWKLFGTQA